MHIMTYYKGPTSMSSGRIRARCGSKVESQPYDHALTAEQNHRKVATLLIRRMKRTDQWQGCMFDNGDWIFVPVERRHVIKA